jgi:hypothetical protein
VAPPPAAAAGVSKNDVAGVSKKKGVAGVSKPLLDHQLLAARVPFYCSPAVWSSPLPTTGPCCSLANSLSSRVLRAA